MKAFETAVKSKDVREIVKTDEAFHDVIYKITENPKLTNIISNLREQMYRYRYEYVKDNANYKQLIDEHNQILEGLKNHDKDYVKKVMHTHLKNQVAGVREVIQNQEKANK